MQFSVFVGYLIWMFFLMSVCVCVVWTVEHDLDQIDYIDSCTAEEEEEEVRPPKGLDSDSLSSQFMAYIEQRRISHEVVYTRSLNFLLSPSKNSLWQYKFLSYQWFVGLGLIICFIIFSSNFITEFFRFIFKIRQYSSKV